MPRTCSICSHPARDQVNADVVAGTALRGIARRFAVSEDALLRHRMAHLPVALTRAHEAAEVAHADSLLDQLRGLEAKALAILTHAEEAGDLRTALLAIGQARNCLELLAKLEGELENANTTVNVTLAAEWPVLRQRIVGALEPFPEARQAVLVSLNGHANR
jgi:hypothetical protein